jgi:hypothetical protein
MKLHAVARAGGMMLFKLTVIYFLAATPKSASRQQPRRHSHSPSDGREVQGPCLRQCVCRGLTKELDGGWGTDWEDEEGDEKL